MELDRDYRLRLAAIARLESLRLSKGGADVVTAAELAEGFEFEGARIPLATPRKGIWKPRQASVALSVLTAPPVPGKPAPYDDDMDEETGFFVYKYEGGNPDEWTNRAVRDALKLRRPIIYFIGLSKGVYEAFYPVYVTGDDPSTLSFRLEVDASPKIVSTEAIDVDMRAPAREYATRVAKVRLHQKRFRQLVVSAYGRRCAICNLRHERLLDAAHILEDRHERGIPEIPNGLALCKIHHSAYDTNLLGIDPDLRIHIKPTILEESDGPMLRWGLQEMHARELLTPRRVEYQPNRDFLAERFERFLRLA